MNQLKTWLLNKPAIFAFLFFGLIVVFTFIYPMFHIESFFDFYSYLGVALILVFIFTTWYTIKKLPHDNMCQYDFVAITNGAKIISLMGSVFFSLIAVFNFHLYGQNLKQSLMLLYTTHPFTVMVLFPVFSLFTLYLLGVAISGFYAKYKRANTLGISKWKIILSMPFTFLMLWTPGYLIHNKGKKSNMKIKTKWYAKFNDFILSKFSNTFIAFLVLLFLPNIFSGGPVLLFSLILTMIFVLWYMKNKSNFIKYINGKYATTAVILNIIILIAIGISVYYVLQPLPEGLYYE